MKPNLTIHLQPEKYLLLVCFFGLILRLFFLFQHDLWFDEAFTYQIAKLSLKNLIVATSYDNNPPLYYLLIHFLLKITNSELVLRLFSLTFGLLTIPFVYLLGKKIATKKIGLASALIFTISPLAIYQSTEVRMYSVAIFLTSLCLYFYLRLKKTSPFTSYFLFGLFFILGFYTNVYVVLLLLPLNLLVFLRLIKLNPKSWFNCQLLIVILVLPWLYTFFLLQRSVCGVCPSSFTALSQVAVSPAISGLGQVPLSEYPKLPLPELTLFCLVSFLFIIFFLKGLLRNFFLSAILLSMLGVLFIFGFYGPYFSPRAFSIFLPIISIVTTLGIYSFSKKYQKALFLALCLLLISVNIIQLQTPFFFGEPLKQSSSLLQKIIESDDIIAHTSLATYYSYKYYLPNNKHLLLTDNPLSDKTIEKIGGRKENIESVNYSQFFLVDIAKWNNIDEIALLKKTINFRYSNSFTVIIGPITLSKYTK